MYDAYADFPLLLASSVSLVVFSRLLRDMYRNPTTMKNRSFAGRIYATVFFKVYLCCAKVSSLPWNTYKIYQTPPFDFILLDAIYIYRLEYDYIE